MYTNSEVDKKEQLRAAVRTMDYSTTTEEESFDNLLVEQEVIESTATMPSSTTLEYADYKGDIEVQQEESIIIKEKYKISARGKALIAVYAFIMISIFAFIIFNATFLRGLDRDIQRAETENAKIAVEVLQQNAKLKEVRSPETIVQEAIEMGMIK